MGLGGSKKKDKEDERPQGDPINYPIIIHKVKIDVTPWNNTQRAKDPPTKKVQDDEVFESSVFDVKITPMEDDVIESKQQEESYVKPSGSVLMKEKNETETLKHSNEYVKLNFPLRLTRRMVVYIFHMKIAGIWTTTTIEDRAGTKGAEIQVSDWNLESIFVTSQRIYDKVSLSPDSEYVYKCGSSEEEAVIFPQGSVNKEMNVKISTLAVDPKCKADRIKDEFGPDSCISCLSDVLYVDHEGKFNNLVTLTLRIDGLNDGNESVELCIFRCDEEGVQICDTPIEKIPGSEVLYRIQVERFSGYGIVQGSRGSVRSSATGISRVLDIGYIKCKILVFLHKEMGFMSLWSEVVKAEEAEVEAIMKKRKNEGLIELPKCRSQTILLRNMGRIRVTVRKNVAITVPLRAGKEFQFITFDRNNYENFISIPIELNGRYAHEFALVDYNCDNYDRRLCHQAHFPAYQYF